MYEDIEEEGGEETGDGSMTCTECGYRGDEGEFMDFPEHMTFIFWVCPSCNHAELD